MASVYEILIESIKEFEEAERVLSIANRHFKKSTFSLVSDCNEFIVSHPFFTKDKITEITIRHGKIEELKVDYGNLLKKITILNGKITKVDNSISSFGNIDPDKILVLDVHLSGIVIYDTHPRVRNILILSQELRDMGFEEKDITDYTKEELLLIKMSS